MALLACAGFAFAQQPVAAAKARPAAAKATPPRAAAAPGAPGELDRTRLPIAEPAIPHSTVMDIRNAPLAPARFQVKAPAGAPNVLIVLIDDMGFGQSEAFGGPLHMPTLTRLADGMVKIETPKDAELPLHDRHDETGHQVGAVGEVADAGQAVLRLLRAGRDARAARLPTWVSSTTRSSSTSSATTAPAPRAACPACSMR